MSVKYSTSRIYNNTGIKAALSEWLLTSCQGMLFTNSLVNARGCRSYQSSTSFSVSNKMPSDKRNLNMTRLFYELRQGSGFPAWINSAMLDSEKLESFFQFLFLIDGHSRGTFSDGRRGN